MSAAVSTPPPPASVQARHENLALAFQELFTAIVRLHSNRSNVTDAELFRRQVRGALHAAEQDAKRLGYVDDDIRLAIFAVVAYLDEVILNLRNPVFTDWVRKPMQEELFGRHTAGEIFFDYLQHLLGRRDSPELADLLEVYYLCLLLGFAGKYSIVGRADLRALMDAVGDKMQRIRGPRGGIAPYWQLADQTQAARVPDPWTRRLMYIAAGCGGLALVLFILYKILLGAGLSELQTLATPLTR